MDKKKVLLASLILLILIPNALAFNPFAWIKSFFVARAPQIVKAEIYPQKIRNSEVMLITVGVKDKYGVESAKVIIPHEYGSDEVDMVLIAGTHKKGTYEARWIAHDLDLGWYNATVIVINNKNKISTQKVAFYDPSQSHPASEVTAGTFGSGNYTFPNNVSIQGTLKGGSPLKIEGGINITSGDLNLSGTVYSGEGIDADTVDGKHYSSDWDWKPQFYNTKAEYDGANASTACTGVWHMCMPEEWIGRIYNTTLGVDGGFNTHMWFDSNTNSNASALGDCDNWTNSNSGAYGAGAYAYYTTSGGWRYASKYCNNVRGVLCCN